MSFSRPKLPPTPVVPQVVKPDVEPEAALAGVQASRAEAKRRGRRSTIIGGAVRDPGPAEPGLNSILGSYGQ
jgi:regulator of RNase E activity RraA